jgi:hypothetical protein
MHDRRAFDPEAVRLVEGLNDLMHGDSAVAILIPLGPKAIPPLRRFLLEDRPSTVYHPRRWAVSALGELGAADVLVEYLKNRRPISDPQVRFAEDAVRDAAIRELAAHADGTVVGFLLDLSRSEMLPSLAEAFGELRCMDALPFLDRALEDDLCRSAAEDAFRKLGPAARQHLVMSAATALPPIDGETPSSRRRRLSALTVLGEIGIEPGDWNRLRPLANDADPEVFVALCVVAVSAGVRPSRPDLVRRLMEIVPAAPWYLHEDIERCLAAWFDVAEPLIMVEVKRRTEE